MLHLRRRRPWPVIVILAIDRRFISRVPHGLQLFPSLRPSSNPQRGRCPNCQLFRKCHACQSAVASDNVFLFPFSPFLPVRRGLEAVRISALFPRLICNSVEASHEQTVHAGSSVVQDTPSVHANQTVIHHKYRATFHRSVEDALDPCCYLRSGPHLSEETPGEYRFCSPPLLLKCKDAITDSGMWSRGFVAKQTGCHLPDPGPTMMLYL